MSKLFSINQIYCSTFLISPIFFQPDLTSSHCPPWDSTHQDQPLSPSPVLQPCSLPRRTEHFPWPSSSVPCDTAQDTHVPCHPQTQHKVSQLSIHQQSPCWYLADGLLKIKMSVKSLLRKHSIATCSQSQAGSDNFLELSF